MAFLLGNAKDKSLFSIQFTWDYDWLLNIYLFNGKVAVILLNNHFLPVVNPDTEHIL